MTGKLSKNFHGVGIGPLSKIYAVKVLVIGTAIFSTHSNINMLFYSLTYFFSLIFV